MESLSPTASMTTLLPALSTRQSAHRYCALEGKVCRGRIRHAVGSEACSWEWVRRGEGPWEVGWGEVTWQR